MIIFHLFEVLLFLCCDLQIDTLVTGCQSLCIFGEFIVLEFTVLCFSASVDHYPESKNKLMTQD